jgi:hypothetical protein
VIWVVAGILAVTGVLSAFAWSLNDHTEHRLLREQLAQAGSTITAGGNGVRQSLASAGIAASAPTGINVAAFRRIVVPLVGPSRQFASVSLWMRGGAAPLDVVGERPAFSTPPTPPVAERWREHEPTRRRW